MLIEEYDVEFQHVAGKENIVADTITRLEADFDNKPIELATQGKVHAYCMSYLENEDEHDYLFIDNPDVFDMAYSFTTIEETKETNFPLYPPLIAKYQSQDKQLKDAVLKANRRSFTTKKVEGVALLHLNAKIYMPQILQSRVVAWYHEYLAHPGEKCTEETITQWFTWPGL